jgi:hypothetical protein
MGHVQGRISPSLDGFDDPNFDSTTTLFSEESPYPEVRAAVANTDDPEMESSTLRAWILGLIFAILIPGVNHLLHFRYPTIVISPARLQWSSNVSACANLGPSNR